ncbi:ECF transporter S component, partial [Candidatus Bathyarchaeota archaeon]|nr:ECF transporter S component [Candidatus Bathyarchaeota archaeon]
MRCRGFDDNSSISGFFRFTSLDLAVIILFSSLGGALSVPVGHLGNFLKTLPGLPLGTSQILSGIHVLWIILSVGLTRKIGSGTLTGLLKGLVEFFMLSFHGALVVVISLVEGLIADLVFTAIRKINTVSLCLAGALSSSSNVFIVKYIIVPSLPLSIFTLMYVISFISG